jgi:hypothetical protein
MSLRSDIEAFVATLDPSLGEVADGLQAILDAAPSRGTREYAVLSLRDGLEPVDSLEEAQEQMDMFFRKPGRARIMHRLVLATEWAALDPAAEGPLFAAA